MNRRRVTRAEFAAYMQGAVDLSPAERLAYEVECVLHRRHPVVNARRKTGDEVIAEAVARAVADGAADGLTEALAWDIVRRPELHPYGATTLARLYTVPMCTRSDGWVSIWAKVAPRILLCAARGELGYQAGERVYSREEISEVVRWNVTVACEDVETWDEFAYWCVGLYAEYTRRAEANDWPVKQHACADRVAWLRIMKPEVPYLNSHDAA